MSLQDITGFFVEMSQPIIVNNYYGSGSSSSSHPRQPSKKGDPPPKKLSQAELKKLRKKKLCNNSKCPNKNCDYHHPNRCTRFESCNVLKCNKIHALKREESMKKRSEKYEAKKKNKAEETKIELKELVVAAVKTLKKTSLDEISEKVSGQAKIQISGEVVSMIIAKENVSGTFVVGEANDVWILSEFLLNTIGKDDMTAEEIMEKVKAYKLDESQVKNCLDEGCQGDKADSLRWAKSSRLV